MMNILIVDDKHDSRYLLEKYLQIMIIKPMELPTAGRH
jgi:CheY-like chemotaxis protein